MAVEKAKLTSISKHARHHKHFVLIIFIFVGLFYWFQIRPAIIRSDCGFEPAMLYEKDSKTGLSAGMTYEEFYNFYYEKCLNQHGLSK